VPRRVALLVATYRYQDAGLRQLTAPGHDAEALAEALRHPEIAGFDVTILVNEPHYVVGRTIGEFYRNRRRDDLTLLYFTGHGLKDDEGRLYLAMTNTVRDDLLFTALSAQQIDYAIDSCSSRQKILVLDCCYSGAFPVGRIFKADAAVHTLERFQGKGRVVLTASDATQYSFEGNHVIGQGTRSVFTRFLVEGLTTGEADLDGDGDISLDELYSYVHDRVIEDMPQQRPKKQENVEGRIVIARNIHWRLPAHVHNGVESTFVQDRLAALESLAHLHRVGNDLVQAEVIKQTRRLMDDRSEAVSAAATQLITALNPEQARHGKEKQKDSHIGTSPTQSVSVESRTAPSSHLELETWADLHSQSAAPAKNQTPEWTDRWTVSSGWARLMRRRNVQVRPEAQGHELIAVQHGERLPLTNRWGLACLARRQIVLVASAILVIISVVVFLVVVITRSVTTRSGVITTIPLDHPLGVAVSPDGHHAFITTSPRRVTVIDTADNTVSATISVGSAPWGVAFTPDGRQAYVANYWSNENAPVGNVSVIDTANNTVSATIPVGRFPEDVAVTPDGRHAYIVNWASGNVSVIDTASNTVSTTISVGTGSFPRKVAVSPDGRHAYITHDSPYSASTNKTPAKVSVIDIASNTVTTTIPLGINALGVAVSPDGRHAYITNADSSTVSVIDTTYNTVTTTIPVGSGPKDVAVTPDGRHAYVANIGSSTVSVIDTANNTVTTTIPMGTNLRGSAVTSNNGAVAVTPDGRHAYITNADSSTVSAIEIATE
jgi:YVTN family beta-propeller protein